MGLASRPYVGSWRLGMQKVVQTTPDSLVYLNGDVALPGCPRCNGKINIQQYLTEVSVDGGTDTGSASASFSLSVPLHSSDSFARDAQYILHLGLEVHVYQRGYFPVRGLYSNLDQPRNTYKVAPSSQESVKVLGSAIPDTAYHPEDLISHGTPGPEALINLQTTGQMMTVLQRYLDQQGYSGVTLKVTSNGGYTDHGHAPNSAHYSGKAVDFQSLYKGSNGQQVEVNRTVVAASILRLQQDGLLPPGGVGMYLKPGQDVSGGDPQWSDVPHMDSAGSRSWVDEGGKVSAQQTDWQNMLSQKAAGLIPPSSPSISGARPSNSDATTLLKGTIETDESPSNSVSQPSLLQGFEQGQDISNVLAYPYYLTFHGVVTQVTVTMSAGTQVISVQCSSMLHFWQFQRVSTNASLFGARPYNSKNKISLVGHNFTGMHPYEIMYTLHNDTAGAAAGVTWALAQKTNVDALSPVTNESVYSMTMRYWEKRFQTRQIRLRMHGADGSLFNAAQAAFLGTTNSAKLTTLLRDRFKDNRGNKDTIMAASNATAVSNNKTLESLNQTARGYSEQDPKFQISLPEMLAYTLDLGMIGQLSYFESTYESKLDVAQNICQITGFEFFQDVDGDFVYKPPFYNLDTSDSRVYRIEDIDIISLTLNEQEPTATYITGKNGAISNTIISGLDNEWGVQGTYIDYRLVAQFGWRPMDFETHYLNDRKAIFFAAVNRLDVMNISMHSGNCTIPLRPEIRPGYPFYFASLDCFYYCTSFAHSYSVGGECTTSLQIGGRRAKFYAPGNPNKQGIEAIDLGDTLLPQRPLEVLDELGQPRLAGFPNVVMALDPTQLNPMFFLAGADIADINSEEHLTSLIKMALNLKIIAPVDGQDGTYQMSTGDTVGTKFYFAPNTLDNKQSPKTLDIRKGADLYAAETTSDQKQRQETIQSNNDQIAILQKQRSAIEKKDPKSKDTKDKDALTAKIKALQSQSTQLATTAANAQTPLAQNLNSGQKNALAVMRSLVLEVGSAFLLKEQGSGGAFGDVNSSANLLEMLSDKKASMTNGSLPGNYRYYSASHPTPEQQGQLMPSIDLRKTLNAASEKTDNPYIASRWKDKAVPTFAPSTQTTWVPGAKKPECSMILKTPLWGIKVWTSNNLAPEGEVIPTSEIRELMFASHDIISKDPKTSTLKVIDVPDLGTGSQQEYKEQATVSVQITKTSSISDAMKPFRDAQLAAINSAVEQARLVVPGTSIPDFPFPDPPTIITLRGADIPYTAVIGSGSYNFADVKGPKELFQGSSSMTIQTVWAEIVDTVADLLHIQVSDQVSVWYQKVQDNLGASGAESAPEVLSEFNAAQAGADAPKQQRKTRKQAVRVRQISSPVFPVSDAKGYEVIGSFRYGRDIDIDPDGSFTSLHSPDVLAILDKATLDAVLQVIVNKGALTIQTLDHTTKDGAPVYTSRTIMGQDAVNYVEGKVLAALRTRMTDDQIIDLRLATKSDSNVLHMQMQNWFTDQAKDGVQKVQLANVGYSLADLSLYTAKNVCSCRMAEADVFLEAAGQDNFVQYIQPGVLAPSGVNPETMDRPTQWAISIAAQASMGWKMSQDLLRGSVETGHPSSVVGAFEDLRHIDDSIKANTSAVNTTLPKRS